MATLYQLQYVNNLIVIRDSVLFVFPKLFRTDFEIIVYGLKAIDFQTAVVSLCTSFVNLKCKKDTEYDYDEFGKQPAN